MADNQKTRISLTEATALNIKPFVVPPVHQDALVKDAVPAPKDSLNREARLNWYHLGVLPGSPHQTVHVSAKGTFGKVSVAFTMNAETVILNRASGSTERSPRRGDFVRMTKEEALGIIARLKEKSIRWKDRANGRGFIVDRTDPRYQYASGDEPLGRYLFMKQVSEDFVRQVLEPLSAELVGSIEGDDVVPETPEMATAGADTVARAKK